MMIATQPTDAPSIPIQCPGARRLNSKISPAHVEAVKIASPILEVVGAHVSLTRAGQKYVGACPWHQSKSRRSFQVSPEHENFCCWGCHVSGDSIEFVRRFFSIKFHDAVIHLARRAGIDLNKEPSRELTEQVALRAEIDHINRTVAIVERKELTRLGSELADARRLNRVASERLAQLRSGAPVRFDDEVETCFAAIALAAEEVRELDVAFCILAFGKAASRESFLATPEARPTMIAEVLRKGYVVNDRGIRHSVALQ